MTNYSTSALLGQFIDGMLQRRLEVAIASVISSTFKDNDPYCLPKDRFLERSGNRSIYRFARMVDSDHLAIHWNVNKTVVDRDLATYAVTGLSDASSDIWTRMANADRPPEEVAPLVALWQSWRRRNPLSLIEDNQITIRCIGMFRCQGLHLVERWGEVDIQRTEKGHYVYK